MYKNHTISILFYLKTLIILVKTKASFNVHRSAKKNVYFIIKIIK